MVTITVHAMEVMGPLHMACHGLSDLAAVWVGV